MSRLYVPVRPSLSSASTFAPAFTRARIASALPKEFIFIIKKNFTSVGYLYRSSFILNVIFIYIEITGVQLFSINWFETTPSKLGVSAQQPNTKYPQPKGHPPYTPLLLRNYSFVKTAMLKQRSFFLLRCHYIYKTVYIIYEYTHFKTFDCPFCRSV